MEQTVEQQETRYLDFNKKIRPFEKLGKTASLPQELITNPVQFADIGDVIFRTSTDIPPEVDVTRFVSPRWVWVEINTLTLGGKVDVPTLTEGRKLGWLERLGLRVNKPNRTSFLAFPNKKGGSVITGFVFDKWGRVEKMTRERGLIAKLPPAEQPKPLIVSSDEISGLEFEFNDLFHKR